MDAGIAFIRDTVFGEVTTMPGCMGLSLAVDRLGNRCITTSSWDTEQSMRDSDQRLLGIRQRGAEIMGAQPTMEEWEVVLMHRDHPTPAGACVRSTWVEGSPANVDSNIEFTRTTTMPQVEQLPGFCSASLLVNRSNGRAIFTAAYDSREAMEAARERAGGLRVGYTTGTGDTILDVREFDLVLAHLHAPELV
jgi:hypothetical protein